MPNMSGHMSVAKLISEKLNIDDKDFYRGNLMPDLYRDKTKSHYKIPGKKYLIPDIERVKKELDLNDITNLGYLTHLLLDKYYLEEYLINIEDNVFKTKKIYDDYDILNKDIIKYFNLDKDYLKKILKEIDNDVDKEKLEYNIECLNIIRNGELHYLEKEKYIRFLEESANRIAEEIKNIL